MKIEQRKKWFNAQTVTETTMNSTTGSTVSSAPDDEMQAVPTQDNKPKEKFDKDKKLNRGIEL